MIDKKKRDEQKALELAETVVSLRDNMPAHLELAELCAKIARRKYLALIAQGFDESQALMLCK